MKTMTCAQLGGPCDAAHHGESADDVIKAQDAHLKERVASGDTTHEKALKEMKGRWKNPTRRKTSPLFQTTTHLLCSRAQSAQQ